MGHIGLSSCQVSRKFIQQFLRSDVVRTDGRTHRADSKIPLRKETKWNNQTNLLILPLIIVHVLDQQISNIFTINKLVWFVSALNVVNPLTFGTIFRTLKYTTGFLVSIPSLASCQNSASTEKKCRFKYEAIYCSTTG